MEKRDGVTPGLVPELDVTDLRTSAEFYRLLGFGVSYERPTEGFLYLSHGRVDVMLQTAVGSGRRFRTGTLEQPFGRGVNFQLEVEDVRPVYDQILAAGCRLIVELEERWYGVGAQEHGNLQFVVAVRDGYLWRPFEDLGARQR